MARRRAGGRPVARDRRRARDTRTVGPPTARIAVIVNQTVSEREGRKRRIVGPVGWGQSLELPRASCRGGVNAKLGCNLSESTASRQTGIVSQGTNASAAGLSPKLVSNPFHGVVAYPEAFFRRDLSRRSPDHDNRRYRAPQSIDQLPDITPCGRAGGNLVEFRRDFLDGGQVSQRRGPHHQARKAIIETHAEQQHPGPHTEVLQNHRRLWVIGVLANSKTS